MSINFTLVKRGYNPVEVDNYIRELEQQLSEYREKSAAINNAIINAQLAADNIIKEAHLKTDKMLAGAENDAIGLKRQALSQLTSIKSNVVNQKRLIEQFQSDYDRLLKKYLAPVETNDVNLILSRLDEIEKLIDELSSAKSAPEKPTERTPEEKAVSKITAGMPETSPSFLPQKEKTAASGGYVSNPYAKPNDAASASSYAKSAGSAMPNPYAKPNNDSVGMANTYLKPNNNTVSSSNPYAKPSNDMVSSNPYARSNNAAPVSNPYAKPNTGGVPSSWPYAQQGQTQNYNGTSSDALKVSMSNNFSKQSNGLNNGGRSVSPFAKKPENTSADVLKAQPQTSQPAVNPYEKPVSPFAKNPVDEEMNAVNENNGYSSFMSSNSYSDSDNSTNGYSSKPGIYKASDLYSSSDKNSDGSFSPGVSKEEMDEFMSSRH